MIRVMVVEDEPAAMSYITKLINMKCPDLEIVGSAEDGREAIDILEQTKVEIVITDIKMAGVDGIELAKWLRQFRPDVLTLIISGHSDFEYAKGAINAGVTDYLLKPIRPSEFVSVMEKLVTKSKQIRRNERERWLKRVFTGDVEIDGAFELWNCERLFMGVVKWSVPVEKHYLPDMRFDYPQGQGAVEDLSVVYLQDETEICFVTPIMINETGIKFSTPTETKETGIKFSTPTETNETELNYLVASLSGAAPYYTAVVKTITPDDCAIRLSDILKAVQLTAVPGVSQTIDYDKSIIAAPKLTDEERRLIKRLYYAISGYQKNEIKKELRALFVFWEHENCRLISVELTLIQAFQFLLDHLPPEQIEQRRDIMDSVSNICHCASGYPDMLRLTLDYCEKLFVSVERESESGRLVAQIEEYILAHLGEQLSTQQICAAFRISSSYLSQLFRKRINMSFIEYVNNRRIEEAKNMLIEFPEMSIKDIAAHLGFSDQFYFSKVFRSITGSSPSEYKSNV